jgi:hypothetical protein
MALQLTVNGSLQLDHHHHHHHQITKLSSLQLDKGTYYSHYGSKALEPPRLQRDLLLPHDNM